MLKSIYIYLHVHQKMDLYISVLTISRLIMSNDCEPGSLEAEQSLIQ